MRNFPKLLLLACAGVFSSGCQSAPVDKLQNAAPKATAFQVVPPRVEAPGAPGITGTVVDAVTKAPLPGLYIKLWGNEGTSTEFLLYDGKPTDAKGQYKFAAKANKDYKLELAETQSKNISYSQLWVSVPHVKNAVTQDIARPRRGIVIGSVRDAAGKPVSASVLFEAVDHEEIGHNTSTNGTTAEGSFRYEVDVDPFTGEAARYNISVGDFWDSGKAGLYSTQVKTIEVSSHVREGDETRVELVLQRRAIVRGQITSGGRPVPNCQLRAGEQEGQTHPEAETTTDAQGRFEMHLSAPGTWKIHVNSPKKSSAEFTEDGASWTRFYGYADVTTSVECVTPGAQSSMNIVLPASSSLSGKVMGKTGKPLAGAKIVLELPGGSVETQSGADGTYSLAGLPDDGPYSVELVRPGQRYGGEPQFITLAGGKTTRLDFDLRPKRATSVSTKKQRTRSKRAKKR